MRVSMASPDRPSKAEEMAKTILTVDDSASVRQLVGMTLRGAGYDVAEAVDGGDSLVPLGEMVNSNHGAVLSGRRGPDRSPSAMPYRQGIT